MFWRLKFCFPEQGHSFKSAEFAEMSKLLRMKLPIHPQSNWMVERFNWIVEKHLRRSRCTSKDWDEHIPLLLLLRHRKLCFVPIHSLFKISQEMDLQISWIHYVLRKTEKLGVSVFTEIKTIITEIKTIIEMKKNPLPLLLVWSELFLLTVILFYRIFIHSSLETQKRSRFFVASQ